jgi:hypothetical protein
MNNAFRIVLSVSGRQGCQMVNFHAENSQFGYILEGLGMENVGTYILLPFEQFYGHMV